ncbi:hypothetical protein MBLNU457_2056t1 [Dothideomycetes sp. NU457]
MPINPDEQLPWYHEPPFDDTRVSWKLWLASRDEYDLHDLRSSFQSWSDLWHFFATHRDAFVRDVPRWMVEAYRKEIERYNRQRHDASKSTPDDDQHNQTDGLSRDRGRASLRGDNLTDRSPKSILTRTRSLSPAKHVSFNPDNLEQYEPVRTSSRSRFSVPKQSETHEKKKPLAGQRHSQKRLPPPTDDEDGQQEEEAYLKAASALTAARLASLDPMQKAGRGRKALKPLLDDDNWSLSAGPGSPLKSTRSNRPASPRTATTTSASSTKSSQKKSVPGATTQSPSKDIDRKGARRPRSASPARNAPKLHAGRGRSSSVSAPARTATRKTSMSPAKQSAKKSPRKRTSSRSRSASPGLEPPRKRTTARSASPRKAMSSDNTQLPTPRSSPERRIPLTPRTRRRTTARGLTKAKQSASSKTTSSANAKSPNKVNHNAEEPATDQGSQDDSRSLETEGTSELPMPRYQNYQGQPSSTHDRHGTQLPYDAFSRDNCLYDCDKHDPDYLSLLGLENTQPSVSAYDAEFHFASELHVPLEVDQSKFDVNDLRPLSAQDGEVRVLNRLVLLRDAIKRFALCYFGYTETADATISSWREMVRCRMAVRELVMYAGYVGDCGDRGEVGWDELLSKPDLRVALVCGIIWKIVKERVLESLFFGATEAQIKSLAAQEKSMEKSDGFERTAARADLISTWYPLDSKSGPPLKAQCTTALALQLQSLLIRLDPHWHMAPGMPSKSLYRHSTHNYADASKLANDPFFRELHYIVRSAATLNNLIRMQPDIVFYWVPVYRGMEFELERMTCANLWPVQRSSPFNDPDADVDPDVKALVRIVCFHGLTSYRRGGGDQARYMLEREKRKGYFEPGGQGEEDGVRPPRKGEDVDVDSGFRSRVLAKAIVALSWGAERPIETVVLDGDKEELVDEGAGKDDARFVELMEICNDERIQEAAQKNEIVID